MMRITMSRDAFGRIACTIDDAGNHAVVTGADAVNASLELLAAVQDADDLEYGDCLWQEAAGDFKWMLRRNGETLTVAVMWSSGVVTGWQHVIRGDTSFADFADQVRGQLAAL